MTQYLIKIGIGINEESACTELHIRTTNFNYLTELKNLVYGQQDINLGWFTIPAEVVRGIEYGEDL